MDDASSCSLIRLSDSSLNLPSFASPHLGSSCRAAPDRLGERATAI